MNHWFLVKKHRKKFRIEWVTHPLGLQQWIEWATSWGVICSELELTAKEKRQGVEVSLRTGGRRWGSRVHGLYWDGWYLYREFDDTQELTEYGLDGFPSAVIVGVLEQHPGEQLIKVEADGVFTMSLDEWIEYSTSDRNSTDLNDLGVSAQSQVVQGRLL